MAAIKETAEKHHSDIIELGISEQVADQVIDGFYLGVASTLSTIGSKANNNDVENGVAALRGIKDDLAEHTLLRVGEIMRK